ncbi:hypothetical protein [Alteriqipengyuania sp. 357]
MDPALLQLLGSLVAILVLAGIARALKLGGAPEIADEDHAMRLAREADSGFTPAEAARSRDASGAILADAQGRIMVLRRHGAHFAARVLQPGARARAEGDLLVVATTERRFGEVTLALGQAARTWESRIEALGSPGDA